MSGTNKKVKDKVWLRALIVLVTLVVITLVVVTVVFQLGEGSATVDFVRKDLRIFLGGTCAFFVVIFGVLLRAYKQLLEILGLQLVAFLLSEFGPESTLPILIANHKGVWLIIFWILIVGGYIYFAFRFIAEGRPKGSNESADARN